MVVGYAVRRHGAGSRLLAVLRHPAHGGLGRPVDAGLAWGDLVMMRKQLVTMAALASRDDG